MPQAQGEERPIGTISHIQPVSIRCQSRDQWLFFALACCLFVLFFIANDVPGSARCKGSAFAGLDSKKHGAEWWRSTKIIQHISLQSMQNAIRQQKLHYIFYFSPIVPPANSLSKGFLLFANLETVEDGDNGFR
jgi:hypothetical protein